MKAILATITIPLPGGVGYLSTTVRWAGDPENTGKTLESYYADKSRSWDLLSIGDLEHLGQKLDEPKNSREKAFCCIPYREFGHKIRNGVPLLSLEYDELLMMSDILGRYHYFYGDDGWVGRERGEKFFKSIAEMLNT